MKYSSLSLLFVLVLLKSFPISAQHYEHLIIYGQSLSTGQQSWPPLSLLPVKGNYMIGSQVWSNYNNPDTTQLNPLVSTIAGDRFKDHPKARNGQLSCECPIVGATNYIQQKTGGKYNLIASSCGFGGKTIEQLSKEYPDPVHYCDFLHVLQFVYSITHDVHCPAIFWMQGEYNFGQSYTSTSGMIKGTPATSDKEQYKRYLLKLKNNMQADVMKQYGQADKPLFITYQAGKQYIMNRDMGASMAQVEASNEYDDIVCAGPVYYLPDRGGHLDPNGYRWYGEMLGKVYIQTQLSGVKFRPLQPVKISRTSNPNEIEVDFLVPCLPLVFDNNLTIKCKDYGFELYLDNQKVNISGVSIIKNTVKLTSDKALNGIIELVYAGPGSKGKGNLRDSDLRLATSVYENLDRKKEDGSYVYLRDSIETSLHPFTPEPKDERGEILYNRPYLLYNFSVAFYYQVDKGIKTYNVPSLIL
ncbi:MAG: hypothetical protein HXX14_16615 [Bacteroidetes bacterium]|nr:hypothetical protein [Bacteroidota bacterium]